jgi:hypothetical protein
MNFRIGLDFWFVGLEVVHEALKPQLVEETAGLRGQQERFARELQDLRQQFAQLGSAQSTSEKKISDLGAQLAPAQREVEKFWGRLPRKKFPFTSEPPNEEGEGQMPAGGLIAHLTEKCGGNVHEKGAVEITTSSLLSGCL